MVGEIANFLQCTMASIKYHLISFIEYTYSMIVEHFSENMQSKHWNIIWINKREMKNVPRIEHLILVWFSRILFLLLLLFSFESINIFHYYSFFKNGKRAINKKCRILCIFNDRNQVWFVSCERMWSNKRENIEPFTEFHFITHLISVSNQVQFKVQIVIIIIIFCFHSSSFLLRQHNTTASVRAINSHYRWVEIWWSKMKKKQQI